MKRHNHKRIFSRGIAVILATLLVLVAVPYTTAIASDDTTQDINEATVLISEDENTSETVREPFDTFDFVVGAKAVATYSFYIYSKNIWISVPVGTTMYPIELIKKDGVTYYYRVYIPDPPESIKSELLYWKNEVGDSVYYAMVDLTDKHDIVTIYPREGYFLGDLDGDRILTVFDLILFRRYIVSPGLMSEKDMELSDLNGDSTVTVADLVLMQKFILGETDHFYPDDFFQTISR